MKSFIFCLSLFTAVFANAQNSIAVVNGTTGATIITSTLDSAYNVAGAGDYIYLPSGNFNLIAPIKKTVNIYGAGMNPDSSLSGITTVNGLKIISGGSNSYFEGIKFDLVTFGSGDGSTTDISAKINNVKFQRCDINIYILGANQLGENLPSLISFNECKIGNVFFQGLISNWIFSKNVIQGSISNTTNSSFYNNVFNCGSQAGSKCLDVSYSNFYNNIWPRASNLYYIYGNMSNNNFYNSINCVADVNSNLIITNYSVAYDAIFIDQLNNYHLRSGCPGINAGTDGTDLGIYGSAQPTKDGWIPSNPHVYYKIAAPQNDASGILHVTFKVKPQAN